MDDWKSKIEIRNQNGTYSTYIERTEADAALDAALELTMPAVRFVNHIQEHINRGEPTPDIRGQEVVCKICGKTITEIFEEGES